MFAALQVEEVKKHSHCLAFSSAGPQSQTYYVSFDSFTEHLRWHRHAAKVTAVSTGKKRNSSVVDLVVFLSGHFFPSHLNLLHRVQNSDCTIKERWQLFCVRAFSQEALFACICMFPRVLTEVTIQHTNKPQFQPDALSKPRQFSPIPWTFSQAQIILDGGGRRL